MCGYNGCCDTCKYFWEDRSVNATECENQEITEEAIIKYYEDGEPGCPFWEQDISIIGEL